MAMFHKVITTRQELRTVLKEPGELVTRMTLSSLDKHCGVFVNQ